MAEEAWWQVRELLTKDQKFLVASRRFMINRGVFQSRKNLKPADAIILSKILDAQILVSSWVEERSLKMKIYEGENGYILWEGQSEFHPAIPISEQLVKLSLRLISDFMGAMPYQGFQVVDEVIGQPVYNLDSKKMAQIFVGTQKQPSVGDPVQWIQVRGDRSQSFLNAAPQVTVTAEGIVTRVINDRIEVEIQKLKDLSDLKENSLVRFPKEVARLKDLYSSEERTSNLGAEYLSAEMKNVEEVSKETHPTATALAFIVNIAAMILLAF